MRKIIIVAMSFAMLLSITSHGQVSKADMSAFAKHLQFAKSNKVGLNPHGSNPLQVPFGEFDYKGVDAVSSKFMRDAYPNQDPLLVEKLFTTIGLDKVVFDKFMIQVFLYCNSEKELTTSMLTVLCGYRELSERIFTQFIKEKGNLIAKMSSNNPYAKDIAERNQ